MKETDFARYLTQFLGVYLPGHLGSKKNTQLSYRDSFSLLLEYCRDEEKLSPEKLAELRGGYVKAEWGRVTSLERKGSSSLTPNCSRARAFTILAARKSFMDWLVWFCRMMSSGSAVQRE